MDKNKQKLIILGVLVLFFIIMLAMRGGKHKPKTAAAPTTAPTATAAVQPKIEAAKGRKVSAFKNWGRDPFAIGGTTAEASGDLILTGIIWDEKKPYCIINGKLAKKGDEIFGCKILEIKKDSVTVKVGDEIRILRIGGKQ